MRPIPGASLAAAVTLALLMSHAAPAQGGPTPADRARASMGGKYTGLIMTLDVPGDVAVYGKFHDHSYYEATTYVGKAVPAGHWVYVAPTWFVWKTMDLAAAGLTLMTRKVKLAKRTITFRFEYKKQHKRWAKAQLTALIRGVREVERWSGVPFPGSNPYRVYEGVGKGLHQQPQAEASTLPAAMTLLGTKVQWPVD